jgi:hypothetical protein
MLSDSLSRSRCHLFGSHVLMESLLIGRAYHSHMLVILQKSLNQVEIRLEALVFLLHRCWVLHLVMLCDVHRHILFFTFRSHHLLIALTVVDLLLLVTEKTFIPLLNCLLVQFLLLVLEDIH